MMTGCASYHAIPPVNFTAADPMDSSVLRVAFDQNGDIYPAIPNDFGLPMPPQSSNNSAPFQLDVFYKEAGLIYDQSQIFLATSKYIQDAMKLSPESRLVVLIHGFNNDYADANSQYMAFREAVKMADPSAHHIYLEIYWDGLFKGRGTAPAPLSYFAKALTYSNLAGMCGLRRIATALPEGTKVTFVTHSRGAAVALSTATDPLFDDGIVTCPLSDRPTIAKLGDVALVAYAPAVGDGHMRDRKAKPASSYYGYFDGIYVGFNKRDPATSKTYAGIKLGGRRGGDTRLGSEPDYIDSIAQASGGRLQYVNFNQRFHGWGTYLADKTNSDCLLWAGRLISAKPPKCELSR